MTSPARNDMSSPTVDPSLATATLAELQIHRQEIASELAQVRGTIEKRAACYDFAHEAYHFRNIRRNSHGWMMDEIKRMVQPLFEMRKKLKKQVWRWASIKTEYCKTDCGDSL